MIKISVTDEEKGIRIDKLVAEHSKLSRTFVQHLISDGNILANGEQVAKRYEVCSGDVISVNVPPPTPCDILPQDIPLDIVYEDEALLIINKPKGLVVHPGAGNPGGTLVNALLYHCGEAILGIGGELRPGIVHRIDKDTSGLLVVAKSDIAHQKLSAQFAQHTNKRVYNAVVHGRLREDHGVIDAPIGRSRTDRQKMGITEKGGKYALTEYSVLAEYSGYAHLSVQLKTGRTHQIRVHMASIGHPVVGDTVYGPKKGVKSLGGQCLHAKTLGFVHPTTNEYVEFDSPLPEYFLNFLAELERKSR